jgi:hypothetical protein
MVFIALLSYSITSELYGRFRLRHTHLYCKNHSLYRSTGLLTQRVWSYKLVPWLKSFEICRTHFDISMLDAVLFDVEVLLEIEH